MYGVCNGEGGVEICLFCVHTIWMSPNISRNGITLPMIVLQTRPKETEDVSLSTVRPEFHVRRQLPSRTSWYDCR